MRRFATEPSYLPRYRLTVSAVWLFAIPIVTIDPFCSAVVPSRVATVYSWSPLRLNRLPNFGHFMIQEPMSPCVLSLLSHKLSFL